MSFLALLSLLKLDFDFATLFLFSSYLSVSLSQSVDETFFNTFQYTKIHVKTYHEMTKISIIFFDLYDPCIYLCIIILLDSIESPSLFHGRVSSLLLNLFFLHPFNSLALAGLKLFVVVRMQCL